MSDQSELHDAGVALCDAIVSALPDWVCACVSQFVPVLTTEQERETEDAAKAAVTHIEGPLRTLLGQGVDEQRSTPLAIIRGAVQFPTAVLIRAGVLPVERDDFAARAYPADIYGLSPAAWNDLGEEVRELGIRWGVIKAFVHRQKHQTQTDTLSSP